MKKSLLFTAIAGLSLGASAQSEPIVLDAFYACGVSDNGRYVASVTLTDESIYDMETGQVIYNASGESFTSGVTRNLSDNGVFLTGIPSFAWLVIDGKEVYPSVLDKFEQTALDAITPDGKYITGKVNNAGQVSGVGTDTDYLPVLYTLENNELSEPTYLPFPTTDVFGEEVQYCSAVAITNDATKILGLVVSNNGFLQTPILYTKDDNGEWSYSLPLEKYINPNNITLPEKPTENPKQWYEYATLNEILAYNAAIDAYESGESAIYPDYWDYMTESELAAYEAYRTDYENQVETYYYLLWNIIDSSINVANNLVNISPDGTKAVVTALIEVENTDPLIDELTTQRYVVYKVDLTTCTATLIQFDDNLISTGITNDGTIFCQHVNTSDFHEAYIYDSENKLISLVDYVDTSHPGWGAWITQKYTTQVISGYTDTYATIYSDFVVTGIPFANGDGSLIACAVEDLNSETASVLKTVIYTDIKSGISNVAIDNKADITISAGRGGVINVSGDAASISVYDLSGRIVYTSNAVDATVSTGLGAGVYVVKATAKDGKSVTAKVAF